MMGLREAYCPKASSMKKSGNPASASIKVYGMRKAPENVQYWPFNNIDEDVIDIYHKPYTIT